jgi:hypothetical protein
MDRKVLQTNERTKTMSLARFEQAIGSVGMALLLGGGVIMGAALAAVGG